MKGVWTLLGFFLMFFGIDDCLLAGASNSEPLVAVGSVNPRIKIDPMLRSRRTGKTRCYLRKTVAYQLDLVQKELEALGLSLKIMDAYRSLSDQKRLWKKFPNKKYVANPIHGSRHNRGAAVDLRLVRLSDGRDLLMPTTKFSKDCYRNYERMQNEEMKKNCKLLELIMEKYGFIPLPTEWWHFDYKDWHVYNVLDVPFEQLNGECEKHVNPVKKTLQSKIKKTGKKKIIKPKKVKNKKNTKKKKKVKKNSLAPRQSDVKTTTT